MDERARREDVYDPKSKKFSGKPLYWTVWREAIVPQDVGERNTQRYKARNYRWGDAADATHYYNEETRQVLERDCHDHGRCCGIYEFQVVEATNQTNRAVVYIGSTHREAEMSLYQRLSEYMRDGSHISTIIQTALDRNFEIHARWIKIGQKLSPGEDEEGDREVAEYLENAYLKTFDYAWNKRVNNRRRKIFRIDVAL